MFQAAITDKLSASQAKAIESAQALAQLAIENAQTIAEIQYDAAKDAVTTAQAKASELLKLKDPKAALEVFGAEEAKAAVAEATAIQSKVVSVIRKGNQEVVEMIESAMHESKADLKKMVKEATTKAPAGSEALVSTFNSVFETTLQSFDQAYTASKDAYANYEKSVETAMSSFQSQFAAATKPAAKSRKAIAA